MKTVTRLIVGMGAALIVSACASLAPLSPEEAVAKRAQARYDALIARDYRTAYGFLAPGLREKTSYEAWAGRRAALARFESAQVLSVKCITTDACDVEIESAYQSQRGVRSAPKGTIERVTPERWVRVDGQWWLYQAR